MHTAKAKKLLCLVLSLLMILGAAPITAFAETATPDYFYIRNLGDTACTVKWVKKGTHKDDGIWYSYSKTTTTAWDDTGVTTSSPVVITLGAGGTANDTVYFKGNRTKYSSSRYLAVASDDAVALEAGGDITTLVNCTAADSNECGNILEIADTTVNKYLFSNLFTDLTSLKKIDNLKLPSKTLSQYCYFKMFNGCTGLTTIPEKLLPATSLNQYCYANMFYNCTGLTSIPEKLLPVTTLANRCYDYMFFGCTGLTTIPEKLLPATTIGTHSYNYMFGSCTGLTSIPAKLLPATTLANSCYAAMFRGCTGLTSIPAKLLPSTTLDEFCYYYMFADCTGLKNAPDLPATDILKCSYANMFENDTNLESVRVNLSAWDSPQYATDYFIPLTLNDDVTLEFVCPKNLVDTIGGTYMSMVDAVKEKTVFHTASYTAATEETENGTIEVDRLIYIKDDTVSVTAKPAKGYLLDADSVKINNGEIELTSVGKKGFTFTMPEEDVVIIAAFKECPHESTTVVDAVAATCVAAGYTGDTYCLDCELLIEEGTVTDIDPDNHAADAEEIAAVPATCGKDGSTAGSKCPACEAVIVAPEVVPATGEHVDADGNFICDACEYYDEAAETLAEAKEDAKAAIEAAIEADDNDDVKTAAEEAKAAIDEATTLEDVEAVKTAGLKKMEAARGHCPYCGQKGHENWIDQIFCIIMRFLKIVEIIFDFINNVKVL